MTRGQKALADLILTRMAEISAFVEQYVSLTDYVLGSPCPIMVRSSAEVGTSYISP